MNKLTIIGNLTSDPTMNTVQTSNGPVDVARFCVAINSRKNKDEVTFVTCSAWRGLAKVVGQYTHKGTKVCVVGAVSLHQYKANGENRAQMQIGNVDELEILTWDKQEAPRVDADTGMQAVDPTDLPF